MDTEVNCWDVSSKRVKRSEGKLNKFCGASS